MVVGISEKEFVREAVSGGGGGKIPFDPRLIDAAMDDHNSGKFGKGELKLLVDALLEAEKSGKPVKLPEGFSLNDKGGFSYTAPKQQTAQAREAGAHTDEAQGVESQKTIINTAKGFGSATLLAIAAPMLIKKFTGSEGLALTAGVIIGGAYAGAAATSLVTGLVGRSAEFLGKKAGIEGLEKFGTATREFSGGLWSDVNGKASDLVGRGVGMIKDNAANLAGISMVSRLFGGKGKAEAAAAGPAR